MLVNNCWVVDNFKISVAFNDKHFFLDHELVGQLSWQCSGYLSSSSWDHRASGNMTCSFSAEGQECKQYTWYPLNLDVERVHCHTITCTHMSPGKASHTNKPQVRRQQSTVNHSAFVQGYGCRGGQGLRLMTSLPPACLVTVSLWLYVVCAIKCS